MTQAIPATQLMGWVRALPARISARYRPGGATAPQTLSADQAEEAFVPVAEQPGREFVVAMIGKFSSPRPSYIREQHHASLNTVRSAIRELSTWVNGLV